MRTSRACKFHVALVWTVLLKSEFERTTRRNAVLHAPTTVTVFWTEKKNRFVESTYDNRE